MAPDHLWYLGGEIPYLETVPKVERLLAHLGLQEINRPVFLRRGGMRLAEIRDCIRFG